MQTKKWTSIGGDLEAYYDGKKYVDIKVKRNNDEPECDYNPFPPRIFMSKEALLSALSLFPNKGYPLGSMVMCHISHDMKIKALVISVQKIIEEKLIINEFGKQEKSIKEIRTYRLQPEPENDVEYTLADIPESMLSSIQNEYEFNNESESGGQTGSQ